MRKPEFFIMRSFCINKITRSYLLKYSIIVDAKSPIANQRRDEANVVMPILRIFSQSDESDENRAGYAELMCYVRFSHPKIISAMSQHSSAQGIPLLGRRFEIP